MDEGDAVMRDVAARIIQHHFRGTRGGAAVGPPAGGAGKGGEGPAASGRRPRTPSAVQPAASSVLDFMPTSKGRPATAGRPASRPPRHRLPSARPAAVQPPAQPQQPASQGADRGEARLITLENSAGRMNCSAVGSSAAASEKQSASDTAVCKHDSPPLAAPGRCASPPCHSPNTGKPPLHPTHRPRSTARQLQMDVRGSASTEKMGHIMQLIERLEQQAAEEARQVAAPCTEMLQVGPAAGAVAGVATPTAAATAAPTNTIPLTGGAAASHAHLQHPLARVLGGQPLSLGSKRLLAGSASDATAALAAQAAMNSRVVRKTAQLLHTPSPADARSGSDGAGEAAAGAAVQPLADGAASRSPSELGQVQHALQQQAQQQPGQAPYQHQPPGQGQQLNTAAMANSVRAKVQQLQAAVAEKDGQVAALQQDMAALHRQHRASLRAAEDGHRAALAAQKMEAEAAASRSLQFIDRVMADKDELSAKCTKLSEELGRLQGEAVKQIEALKDGLAREMRRQKEMWVAAERAKRETWMAEQTRSIKDSTIKGLEPEIQRLVEAHKAETKRAEQRHETETARRLAAAAAQHEEAVAGLRTQWAVERAAAVETERTVARDQIKDAQGRFEVELQSLRMRLAAEHQMQLDRADAARREDHGRLHQAAQEYEQRVAALRTEWEAEKTALARQREQEVEAVRQQYENNQEAWRAAASERARREMEAREGVVRRQLERERDEELAAVVARMDEDALAKEAAMQKQLEEGEAAAEQRWRDEVARLRGSEAALSDKCAVARAAGEEASARVGRLEELVHTLQKEVSGKGSSLAWLEDQLAAARREATNRQEAGAEALAAARQQHARERAELEREAGAAREAAQQAEGQAASLRQRRVQEMAELQGRFTGLLATKDTTIASLTQQLQELQEMLA